MKKHFLPIAIVAIALTISSCGSSSSFDSDVRKMADYQCKIQKLMAKDPADEAAKKEAAEIRKEIEAYAEKMEKKYESKKGDKEMEAKADAIMKEVMDKCK
jgi:hypothetical protein